MRGIAEETTKKKKKSNKKEVPTFSRSMTWVVYTLKTFVQTDLVVGKKNMHEHVYVPYIHTSGDEEQ